MTEVKIERWLEDYREMWLIRRFEEESARAYAQGKVGGFLHLYIGQESIAVAAATTIQKGDYVFQTYRDHGTALALGMTPEAAMAELYGKDTGCSRGLGGSMHYFDVENGFYGGWGIVGGHLALAAGAAFRSKYLGEDQVTLCFFGEGATNIGGFHEAMSLAGLWKLPAVFICENNQYAMGTPLSRTSPLSDLSVKAAGYGMAGDRFEGYDIDIVREHLKKAIDRARSGEGPSFLEIETYRFRGHSMSDPGKYRTAEELEERKQKDPILIILAKLKEHGVAQSAIDAIDDEVEERVEAALRHAEEAPFPEESLLYETVSVEKF